MSQSQLRLVNGRRVKVAQEYPYGSYIAADLSPEEGGLEYSALDYLAVSEELPKVPKRLFDRVIKFFYDYASQGLEVHARVVYNPRSKEFKVFIPTQTITGASVEQYDYTQAIDLETGEKTALPHKHFATLWQWHVHPFNLPDPSSIDDDGIPGQPGTGELDRPGGYGVASTWRKREGFMCCTLRCTVVVSDGFGKRNKRLSIPTHLVVEGLEEGEGEKIIIYKASYSANAHSVVSRYVRPVVAAKKGNNAQFTNTLAPYWQNYLNAQFTDTYSVLDLDTVVRTYTLDEIVASLVMKYDIDAIQASLNKVEQ